MLLLKDSFNVPLDRRVASGSLKDNLQIALVYGLNLDIDLERFSSKRNARESGHALYGYLYGGGIH